MAAPEPRAHRLVRPPQPMVDFVRTAIEARGLMDKYALRPFYQRNDYLMWINSAKLDATKYKRLGQMLDELERGDLYMAMKWHGDQR